MEANKHMGNLMAKKLETLLWTIAAIFMFTAPVVWLIFINACYRAGA